MICVALAIPNDLQLPALRLLPSDWPVLPSRFPVAHGGRATRSLAGCVFQRLSDKEIRLRGAEQLCAATLCKVGGRETNSNFQLEVVFSQSGKWPVETKM